MRNRLLFLSVAASVVGAWTATANAHAVWVAQRTGELAVVYGHGVEDDPYDPAKVKDVKGYAADGAAAEVKVLPREKNVVIEPAKDAALIELMFDNGYWTQRANGEWENVGKSKITDAKSAGHYVKHVLAVVAPLSKAPAPTDLQLQILPLADPLALTAGMELPVRVLLNGKPLTGGTIIPDYANDPDGKGPVTDANGEAKVLVRNNGLNVIALSHTEQLEGNPDADERGHFASLSFMLFDKEE
jgi:uncharacterized GH25 family protein